jgi:hypothetical protein
MPYRGGAGGGSGGLAGGSYYGRNLIKNSPGQIVVDTAEPQWWDDVANAAITDEGTAGEGIPDIHERCFKVVTTANNVYGYQTLTFADEELLDAGVTVVSLGCWVYCATGSKASIGIFGTNLTLQESSQVGAAEWTWLTVENITLNAADATIEVRLIVDTDTAWFTMPMLTVGLTAQPWMPRDLRFVAISRAITINLGGQTDIAWSDVDFTADTDPLAVHIQGELLVLETVVSGNTIASVGHSDDIIADTDAYAQPVQRNAQFVRESFLILVNDGQVGRYKLDEADADSDVSLQIRTNGYWMWT